MKSLDKILTNFRKVQTSGLAAMAGGQLHAAHLGEVDKQAETTPVAGSMMTVDAGIFEEAVKPLMKYLADYHHPHISVLVDSSSAEMFEATKLHMDAQFVRD